MKKKEKVFRSRISVLISGLVFVPLVLISILMIKLHIYAGLFIICGTTLLVVLIFTGMRYEITVGKLYWKMWSFPCGSVRIFDILSVERSYNPLSSPAASLKRLRISLKKEAKYPYMLISPAKEQEFIRELKAVNPDIYVNVPDKKRTWRIWDWDI